MREKAREECSVLQMRRFGGQGHKNALQTLKDSHMEEGLKAYFKKLIN